MKNNVTHKDIQHKWWVIALSFIIYHLAFSHAVAQEFGMRWLYCAEAEPTQQVWFKRNIHTGNYAKTATLSIASEGRCIVYINGYNVSADLFSSNPRGAIGIHDYDVARFLNEGNNSIAVWYSPTSGSQRQLYATLHGEWLNGGSFHISNDKGWICRPANANTLSDGREEIDGQRYMSDWKEYDWKDETNMFSEWKPAQAATNLEPAVITFCRHDAPGYRMLRILKQAKVSQQGRALIYDFGQPVEGWVRITMRGMKKGEVIEVNGLRYICKGGSDDQACRRFTTSSAGTARIILPAGRSRTNITRVEAISIGW